MKRWLLLAPVCITLATAGCSRPGEPEPGSGPPAECVVFDIDGTLTPTVAAIHTARDGAATAVQAFADAGYVIIYLSARIGPLQGGIPDWLEDNGFPGGRLHLTESREERKDPAAFKASVLDDYRAAGWRCIAAYGDSSTDFEAYATAGIRPERIFALKRAGAKTCQPGSWSQCFDSWEEQRGIILDIIEGAY